MKSFSSCQNVFFDHTDVTFKSFSKKASAGFFSVSSPFTRLWCFQVLNCLRFLFFTILRIDDRLIPVCSAIFLGAKCVWGGSSFEQTNSSIKSLSFSVETVLGCPEPCLLSIELDSLNFFNRCLTEEQFHFLDGWFFQIL